MHLLPLRRFPALLAVLFTFLFLVASGPHAVADQLETEEESNQTWAVVPATEEGPDGRASFEFIAETNDTYTDRVAVRNIGNEELTVTLFAHDAVQSLTSDYELLTEDDEAGPIGQWTTLGETTITIPARDHVVVPFEIAVPEGAGPGDHAGGIVAVNETTDEGSGAQMQYRVGTRINLRVSGPVDATLFTESLDAHYNNRINPFAHGSLDIGAQVQNQGNVRLETTATANVQSIFGWWKSSAELEGLMEMLPGGTTAGNASIMDVPALGPLWVSIEYPTVTSLGQDVTEASTYETKTVVVWAVPWVLVAVIILALIPVVNALINLRKRRKLAKAASAEDARSDAPTDAEPSTQNQSSTP